MLDLNTKNEARIGQDHPVLYIPMDPKYFYPATYLVKDTYSNQLLNTQNNGPYDAGLEDLMYKRGEIIDSRIRMIFSEIYERNTLLDKNIYQISVDQCNCKNLIYMMDRDIWDKKRIDIERKIIDLEQEKRLQQANCFRDLLFIRKELRESLVEKLEEKQKTDMLCS